MDFVTDYPLYIILSGRCDSITGNKYVAYYTDKHVKTTNYVVELSYPFKIYGLLVGIKGFTS